MKIILNNSQALNAIIMTEIAETAVVDKTADLGQDVIVGPGCVIGPGAVVEDRCELKANVCIAPHGRLGKENRVFANCVLGEEPQSLNQTDQGTTLVIGDHNVLRENVTLNRGSSRGPGKTRVGNGCYFMTGVHVGHDCEIDDEVVLCNSVHIGGHV
ncbi:MAG: acyl-[acyl-carrier-protein]--UDP-N-acetylglucosamine O-acyltransferase, partial [Planctomycetes bacterium]|nr:acyl-[acyl-carrier-protein]--UDP-N-acetylglucosamine O-acyltransferase [Planctomycetota bacterium]